MKHRRDVRSTVQVAGATATLLFLGACAGQDASPRAAGDRRPATTVEETVKADLVEANDALNKLLDEEPGLTTEAVTVGRLRAAGYTETSTVSLTFAVEKGDYCLYAVPRKADTPYGIDAKSMWFIASDQPDLRQTPIAQGRPVFPEEQAGDDRARHPCVTIQPWRSP